MDLTFFWLLILNYIFRFEGISADSVNVSWDLTGDSDVIKALYIHEVHHLFTQLCSSTKTNNLIQLGDLVGPSSTYLETGQSAGTNIQHIYYLYIQFA